MFDLLVKRDICFHWKFNPEDSNYEKAQLSKMTEGGSAFLPRFMYPGCQRSSRSPAARSIRASSACRLRGSILSPPTRVKTSGTQGKIYAKEKAFVPEDAVNFPRNKEDAKKCCNARTRLTRRRRVIERILAEELENRTGPLKW